MNDVLKGTNGGQNGATRQPPAASAFGANTSGQDVSAKITANVIARLLASSEPEKWAEGLEKLGNNERALAYTVNKTANKDLKDAALANLSAISDRLTDEGALVCVAIGGNNTVARVAATERLQSQEALAKVAMESVYGDSKSLAVSKLAENVEQLTSVNAIICVAMDAEPRDAKTKAIAKLAPYPGALLRVVLDSGFKDSRLMAFKLLQTDIEALKYIAKYCKFEDARMWAVIAASKHKSAEHALVRIAIDSEYADARLKAVELLGNNEGALAFVVMNNEDHQDSKDAAVARLVSMIKELQNVNALICVVLYADELQPKLDAAAKLNGNPDALVRVTLQSDDAPVRNATVQALSGDGEALEYLATVSQDVEVRVISTKGLKGHEDRLMRLVSEGVADVKEHAKRVLALGYSNFEIGLTEILMGNQAPLQELFRS